MLKVSYNVEFGSNAFTLDILIGISDQYGIDIRIGSTNETCILKKQIVIDKIKCRIENPKKLQLKKSLAIKITIGNLNFTPGNIRLIKKTRWLLVGTATAAVIVFVALTIFVIWLYKCGGCEKMTPAAPQSEKTRSCEELHLSPTVRRPSNAYSSSDGTLRSQQESVRLLSVSIVDDETMRVLHDYDKVIPNENVILGEKIGDGHFGTVHKASMIVANEDRPTIVAVKTINKRGEWSKISLEYKLH